MRPQPFRTVAGGRVDRARGLKFRFDGRTYAGLAGDTLASALLANGVRIVGRSFRLHRPRGLLAAGAEEPNAIMQLGAGGASEANIKATQTLLVDGLEARAVNAWPNARFDVGSVLGLFSGLLTAGFYYKTFKWPAWGLYAPWIRRAAGLGTTPSGPDPDLYATTFAECDVLVIGAGPAGLAAAEAAASLGERLVLVDDKPYLGGALTEGRYEIAGLPAADWVALVEATLAASGARVFVNTTALAWYDGNLITLIQELAPGAGGPRSARKRLWKVRAKRVVLAAGAFERPLVFGNNDRPGVMLAAAARAYAVRFGVLVGRRAVIATNNDSAYEAALDLMDAGTEIAAIADSRSAPPAALADAVRARGVSVLAGHAPTDTAGRPTLTRVTLCAVDPEGRAQGPAKHMACDLLATSGGWNPVVHLFSQSGGRLRYDESDHCFKPDAWTQAGVAAGAARGVFTVDGALADGAAAGRATLAALDGADETEISKEDQPASGVAIQALWEVKSDGESRALVDFQNDVTSADVRRAACENYASVEHLKRYTTLGMALDQGKTSNVNGIGVLSEALDKPIADIGVTTFRPPFNPVRFGAVAGRRLDEAFRTPRRLPSHRAQQRAGAVLEDYGGWLRPAFYPRPGEGEEACVRREHLAVRAKVGFFEASPLGKILVAGPDAGRFLDRVYVGRMSGLKPGRCRYGLMLAENGGVLDDGVVMRLDPSRFLVGTTSARADYVAAWLEEWLQCEWPQLEVVTQPLTSQWATIAIAGPKARGLLAALRPGMDVSDYALPHMDFAEGPLGVLDEAPCRVARVSFTGERSYEISVAADLGEDLWLAVAAAGWGLGGVPFGVEPLMRLRLEKGYPHVGVDTDSTTYPQDLGHGVGATGKERDFIGRRSTLRESPAPRRQLVGLEAREPADPIGLGGHILSGAASMGRPRSEGWVTSSCFSPVLRRWVALALVERGSARLGETVRLLDRGKEIDVRIREVCSYDPFGVRLNA